MLDNTGSMADSNKITALRTATNNLLTQLKNAVVNNGDVYVSIIPFVKDVNVDPVNYNQPWIDWTDWNAVNGTCSRNEIHGPKQLRIEWQDLDARESQYLERLRHRSRYCERTKRPEHRHQRGGAASRRSRHPVSGRTIQIHVPRRSWR